MRKIGRPRKTLPTNGVEVITDLASRGANETQIAKRLGLSYEVWQRLREEDPKAQAAWTAARAVERDQLVGMLYRQAIDEKNTVAAIFLLKSRHGYRDVGDVTAERGGTNVVINLPSAMSEDQYKKLVEVSPVTIPQDPQRAVEPARA